MSETLAARLKKNQRLKDFIWKVFTPLPIVFIVIALFEGIVFSFLFPTGQVPDEYGHYAFMEGAYGTKGYHKQIKKVLLKKGGLLDVKGDIEARVDREKLTKVSKVKFKGDLTLSSFHPNINILKYLPAGIGFYIGVALGLPILACTHMAEIFATIFYVIIGALTIKIAPIKKDLFMFVLLSPMVMQQCSSINYDVELIPLALLLFAYILKMFYQEEKIRWRQIILALLITFVIAIIKAPYLFILGTILIIPYDHFDLKIGKKIELASIIRRFWYIFLVLIIAAGVLLTYLGRENNFIKTIIADVMELPSFISVMNHTFVTFTGHYITGIVAIYGWFELGAPLILIVMYFGTLTYINSHLIEEKPVYFSIKQRLWLIFMACVAMLFVFIALQTWTLKIQDYDITQNYEVYRTYVKDLFQIVGVQGRYFIPVLPIAAVAISGTSKIKHKKYYYLVLYFYYASIFFNVAYNMYIRYWV